MCENVPSDIDPSTTTKYDWWHHNRWFATTSFSGFRFIHQSKKTKEAILWYTIIIILYIVSFIIVGVEVSKYFQYPTTTNAKASSGLKATRLPNVAMTVRVPLIEYDRDFVKRNFEEKNPCQYLDEEEHHKNAIDKLLKRASQTLYGYHNNLNITIRSEVNEVSDTKNRYTDTWDQTTEPYPASSITCNEKCKCCDNDDETEEDYKNDMNGDWLLNRIPRNMRTKTWNPYAYYQALLHLEAIMENQNMTNRKEGDTYLIYEPPAKLINRTMITLKRYFKIKVTTNIDGKEPLPILKRVKAGELTQEDTYHFIVPEGMTKVMATFRAHQIDQLIQVLSNFSQNFDTENQEDICSKYVSKNIGKHLIDKIVKPMINYYKNNAQINLETPGGNLFIKPFTITEFKLVPTAKFISETKDCYTKSLEECEIGCVGLEYLKMCNCIPWTLYYAHTNMENQLCNYSCQIGNQTQVIKENCYEECIENSAHSCNSSLFRLEQSSETKMELENLTTTGTEFFHVTVMLDRYTTYPLFVETYSYSFLSLVIQIGGILCFWVGIRVVGFAHMIYYFVKQIIYIRQPESKVRKTLDSMRKTKTKAKIHQMDSVMPNRDEVYSMDSNTKSDLPQLYDEEQNAVTSKRIVNCEMKMKKLDDLLKNVNLEKQTNA